VGDRKIDLGWGLASMTVREYEVRGYIHLYREKWLNPVRSARQNVLSNARVFASIKPGIVCFSFSRSCG